MTRPPVLRALLALLVLGLSAYFSFTKEPRLGLDLRGGASITLETQDTNGNVADAEGTDRTVEVLRRRVDDAARDGARLGEGRFGQKHRGEDDQEQAHPWVRREERGQGRHSFYLM